MFSHMQKIFVNLLCVKKKEKRMMLYVTYVLANVDSSMCMLRFKEMVFSYAQSLLICCFVI